MNKTRRTFIKQSSLTALGMGVLGINACQNSNNKTEPPAEADNTKVTPVPPEMQGIFGISLAQWSLHRTIQEGKLDPVDFPVIAKKDFGIDAVEYVTQFFQKRASDMVFLREMKKRADDNGVKSLLIMVDGEGELAHPDGSIRDKAVRNHYQWVEAAHFLGCHSIRVNAAGVGSPEDMARAGVTGLSELSDFAKDFNINVIVENHGGNSSNGKWLSEVISQVNMPNCGTLPDFGNFCIEYKDDGCAKEYNRYRGVEELMPFAKAVSAKSYDFDEQGNETTIDFSRMIKTMLDSGYKGYVGIEYEGNGLSEAEGIRATKKLLERIRGEMEKS